MVGTCSYGGACGAEELELEPPVEVLCEELTDDELDTDVLDIVDETLDELVLSASVDELCEEELEVVVVVICPYCGA